MQTIIFKNEENQICVAGFPQELLATMTVHEIAQRTVPTGKPYKICDHTELPQDIPQEYWEIDDAELNDGVGA